MKIRPLSDLHLEFDKTEDFASSLMDRDIDVVVLSGDIHIGARGVAWARGQFTKPVIYVLGNHEFYNGELWQTIEDCRNEAAGSHVHVLENECAVVKGVRFIGATLWTGFDLHGDRSAAANAAELVINDFRLIRLGGEGWLTADRVSEMHRASRGFIVDELSEPFDGPTVLVTHFPVHRSQMHKGHDPDGNLQAYFNPHIPEIFDYRIDACFTGHTHWCHYGRIAGTRLVSNQRGYPGVTEPGNNPVDFDPELAVEIS